MDELKKCIVLAAGGTGGHIFPAQALAHELSMQGYEIFKFSDDRGHQFNGASLFRVKISASSLQGSVSQKLRGGIKLARGIGTALYHLRRLKPQVVVGFGGYASFPTMGAAVALRLPTIIHQADAYFGRANHLFGPFVTRIA